MYRADTRTLIFRPLQDGLALLVHGPTVPADADWEAYLESVEAYGRVHREGRHVDLLVITDVHGPSAAQRQRLERRAPRGGRVAVVTASTVARSIVTLIGWVEPGIRAFAPPVIADALDYLRVPRDRHPELLQLIATLRARLSGVAGADTDEAARSMLDRTSIEPMAAILQPLGPLRQELVARRRV